MRPLYSAWSWLFCVSDPNDPKLRGWLHPALALGFNLGLSFVLASAAFLAAPTQFHEEWLQHQSPQFLSFIHGLASVASFVGLQPALLLPWARSTLGRVLLPEELLLDKKQAFSLYSWEKGTLQPQAYALFLLLYAVLMVTCRLYEKGPMMLYDAAWACNTSMIVTAAAIWLNIPFLVSACSCWVAIDQLLWYVDMLYLLIRGRFLIGVAKYLTNRDTVRQLEASSAALTLALQAKQEKGSMDVLNVNVSWRCWADVAHHIPFLGICDNKPWYLFLLWNQLIWGMGNCFLFGVFLTASNLLRREHS
ncbi:uncharacterized protein LOC34617360 [Cyclospora cayetanensis]|uniref:Uncharacterized protein LOC34617360 n=1 Tax=Cyclospora cayetanensis TaxID=88456 RepID=A0A6P6S2V3_9EIME|nr:uncharacterized protein LOC34617360 [Cyclospora cayetanensis]